jgi:hypothetical protein
MDVLEILSDWSEVWSLLIPLIIIIVIRPKEEKIRLVVWYVIIALVINFIATFMLVYYYEVPEWLYVDGMVNNNILYNTHSVVRVLLFGWYIITVRRYRFPVMLKTVLGLYFVLVLVNFIFLESPFFLSTRLFAAESIVLLILALNYFFRSIHDESKTNWLKHPSFLVCAGVSLYEVITFFIFLFFYPLSQKDQEFFIVTMRIYTITFVVFCILLAMAFYESRTTKKPFLST